MHLRLPPLLDQLPQGLLWVSHSGTIRHANAEARCLAGLSTPDRLPPGPLLVAVRQAIQHRVRREACLDGRPARAGALVPQLLCTVLPGLAEDDAIVQLGMPSQAEALDTESLMRLLQDDVGAALRRTQAALSIARADQDAHGVAVLLDELDELVAALTGVVAMAALWRTPFTPTDDRIDPLQLLRDAWADVAALAHHRAVRLQLVRGPDDPPPAPLYGSRAGLLRVLTEALRVAVGATVPGGVLRLELRPMGPRCQLVFLDVPNFLLRVAGQQPAADHVHRLARDQTAWHLCRRILALHGGQMLECSGDGATNFMIDLPCGAPFPADNSAMDAEQVQRYAHDLAALVARNRQGGRHSGPPSRPRSFAPASPPPQPHGALQT